MEVSAAYIRPPLTPQWAGAFEAWGSWCGATTMELYIFYHELNSGMDCDTLYKFKLPSLPITQLQLVESEDFFSPFLEIPYDKYPCLMGCVQLDSKLYFFGGHYERPSVEFDNIDDDIGIIDVTDQYYSPQVYVFDLNADDDQGLNQLPSMSTGKPNAFGFAASGMLYVLGGSVRCSSKLSDDLIKRFERFNPVDGKWKVLDDAPLRCLSKVIGATMIETQHKVLISGWRGKEIILMFYDFLHERWDSDRLPASSSPYLISHIAASDYNDGGLYLYGPRASWASTFPFKLGPLKELDHIHKGSSIEMSILDTPKDCIMKTFRHRISRHMHFEMLHLGDGHFCYVASGQGCFPNDFLPPCPHTRGITIAIFKDLSSPGAVQKEGKGQTYTFEAKILYGKKYFKRMDSHGYAILKCCFILDRDSMLKHPSSANTNTGTGPQRSI